MTSRSELPLESPGPRAAIVALVVLVAAILSAVVVSRPRASSARAAVALVQVSAEPPEQVAAPTVPALIDAIPWGRIDRIETPDGEPYPLPDPNETPVLLELPAGEWRVVLSNPDFTEARICDLRLIAAERQDCLVEFRRLSVDQYFREAGWWR